MAAPRAVPLDPRLRVLERRGDGYSARVGQLRFIVSDAVEEDGRVWRHASVSRTDRQMPTYDDLRLLKECTIGAARTAIQVFPPADRHIDIAGRADPAIQVLHLWSPETDFLPDFARAGDSI